MGKLHREQRHPTRSLGHHDVSFADVGFSQGAPRRDAGARDRRGFDIGEVIGRADQAGDGGDAVLL